MEVTGLAPRDRPQWANLWRAYLAFYGTCRPDEVFEHTWRRMLDNTALHGLAARIDGQIAGIPISCFMGAPGPRRRSATFRTFMSMAPHGARVPAAR